MSEALLRQIPMGVFVPLLSQALPSGCRFFACTSHGDPLWISHGSVTPAERSILSTALLGNNVDNPGPLQSRLVTGFGTLIWQGLGTGGIGFPGYLLAVVPDSVTPPPIGHLTITFNAVCTFIREVYRSHLELAAMKPHASPNIPLSPPALPIVVASESQRNQIAKLNHDLRSPLNAILGYAALVIEGMQKDNQPQHVADLEKIQTAANKLLDLINRVIESSQSTDEKNKPTIEPCLIMQLLADVAFSVQPLLERRATKLELSPGKELIEIRTEAGTLRSMLIDLITAINNQAERNTIVLNVNESEPHHVLFELSSLIEIPHFNPPHSLAEGAKRIAAEITSRRDGQRIAWSIRLPRVLMQPSN